MNLLQRYKLFRFAQNATPRKIKYICFLLGLIAFFQVSLKSSKFKVQVRFSFVEGTNNTHEIAPYHDTVLSLWQSHSFSFLSILHVFEHFFLLQGRRFL